MPNTQPIFPNRPNIGKTGPITAANTAKDGTGTVATAFTAGANGSKIDRIVVRALGTNVATVMRFFVNDGLGTAAVNNSLVHETPIAVTTSSEVAALADATANDITSPRGTEFLVPIPYLAPNHKLNVTIGTTVAAGLQVTVFGGDF